MLNYYLRDQPAAYVRAGNHIHYAKLENEPRIADAEGFCRVWVIEAGAPAAALEHPLFRAGAFAVAPHDVGSDTFRGSEYLPTLMSPECAAAPEGISAPPPQSQSAAP